MSLRLRVPEVIALTELRPAADVGGDVQPPQHLQARPLQCQYCGDQPGGEELTIDHVVPRAQGGVSSWTNCVLACIDCNKRKADRTPQQAGMKLQQGADSSDVEAGVRRPPRADRKLVEVHQRSVLERRNLKK